MNLPRTTDQARKELKQAVDEASPIQILMFLVIFQAVQIIQYVQNVQKSLPTPRKSLPPLDPTTNLPWPEATSWAMYGQQVRNAIACDLPYPEPPILPIPDSPTTISLADVNPDNAFIAGHVPGHSDRHQWSDDGLRVTWVEESQEMTPEMWDHQRRMADAQQRRHQILDDIIPEHGTACDVEDLENLIEDAHDRERQIRFEHCFPGYTFDQEKYQYAMDYDGAAYFPHAFIEDRETALRFKIEARRFEIQNGQGRYLIAGMPSHQYRDMQRQDRQHFGMVGYCTPHRGMEFSGGFPASYGDV